jgi:transcriptional regulator GlxA family with amidase domain
MNLPIHDSFAPEQPIDQPLELALVLLDGFALMSYAAFVEPLRAANTLANRELYRWRHVSLDGAPVLASNGATFLVEHGLDAPVQAGMAVVFAGGDPRRIVAPGLAGWLRRQDRAGKVLVGVSAGPYLLAAAGLLDARRATIHWDHRDSFQQDFPKVLHEEALYVIDGRRVTCAGGMAGMDLVAGLIRQSFDAGLAARVGDWFIHPEPRPADRPQRQGLGERYRTAGPRVLATLAAMEDNLDEPLTREALATRAGTTVRQMERLFAREVGEGVARHYLQLRLERAAQLLRTTGLPVTEIALACGFRASSHFSRAFAARFGVAPARARGMARAPRPAAHQVPIASGAI